MAASFQRLFARVIGKAVVASDGSTTLLLRQCIHCAGRTASFRTAASTLTARITFSGFVVDEFGILFSTRLCHVCRAFGEIMTHLARRSITHRRNQCLAGEFES